MKFAQLSFFLFALALTGCATFKPQELAAIRARGVEPAIMAKLARDEPLTPPEISALSRRGVPDAFIERHLQSAGVDYLLTRQDVRSMRQSGVSARVVDAVLAECDRFARRYQEPVYATHDYWWGDSVYFGPSFYSP
jgi:hypothetical protein